MEPPHNIYNQAGPSNFTPPFTQDARPPPNYGSGRGRGQNGHRHAPANHVYHQSQQPYYTMGPTGSYGGYPIGMNGANGMPIQGQYPHAQNGVPPARRAGPNFHAPSYQAPASPSLHPAHVYNPHAPPYIPQTAVPAPMYHYSHTPAHVQPYPTAFSPPMHQPPYTFQPHQNAKSPLISPLPDHTMSSPRLWKAQSSSPRPLQVPSVPLPQHQNQAQSPAFPSKHIVQSPPVTDSPPRPTENRPISPPVSENTSPVPDVRSFSPQSSPSNTKIALPTFENEPAPLKEWVISAFRPDDPAAAFGIMISPKAKPPTHIVEGAQTYVAASHPKTPSIKPKSIELPQLSDGAGKGESQTLDVLISQTDHVSGSATETESRASTIPDTFVAGSPISTATSVSVAPPKTDVAEKEPQAPSVPVTDSASAGNQSPKHEVSETLPTHAAAQSSSSLSNTKKSWASLLRPDGASSSKTSLPISSVHGFSIPASSTTESTSVTTSGPSGKRNELLHLLNNGPNAASAVPQIRPRGLVNTGNMCFANAVLQTLVYTPPFFRLFTELGKYISGTGSDSTKWGGKETPLVNATVEFLKEFKPKVKENSKNSYEDDDDYDDIDSFIPTHVYEAMKEKSRFENMGGGQQEDAEEFFGFFLDTLEEELLAMSSSLLGESQAKPVQNSAEDDDWLEVGRKNKAIVTRSNKSLESPMTRIFGGKFRMTLKVPGQRDSAVVEDWRSLQLDIQREQVNSIEDALRSIPHPQSVQLSSVTKGGALVEASQQCLVDALPPILVLHLKRFTYDTAAKDVVKVHKQVSYGPELEIPSDVLSPARRNTRPDKYKLFSVLYHHGQSAAGGHYTLDVLHPNRNADANAKPREGWIRIDDELVSDMRSEDVFGNDRDCAYLLFYRRIGGGSYARAGQN